MPSFDYIVKRQSKRCQRGWAQLKAMSFSKEELKREKGFMNRGNKNRCCGNNVAVNQKAFLSVMKYNFGGTWKRQQKERGEW